MAAAPVRWSVLLITSLSLLSLMPNSTSEPTYVYSTCANSTTFAPNSQYHTNLKTVLGALFANATAPAPDLFFATSAGTATPDAVYGLFLCRGDQNASTCQDCVNMAIKTDFPTFYCTNMTVAIIYYDQCMVRYSNQPILGKLDQSTGERILKNDFNRKGGSTLLNLLDLVIMLNDSMAQAAAGDKSGKKFAVKHVNFATTQDLYTMLQCTPDLSPSDCSRCLNDVTQKILLQKQGAQVLRPNCIARYESYPFYTGALASPVTANSTGNSTAAGRSGNSRQRKNRMLPLSLSISVPTFVGAIVLVLGIYTCLQRRKAIHKSDVEMEEIGMLESLQFDLNTLRLATHNFSLDNKLGEGGFGEVYKGKFENGQEVAVKRLSKNSGQGIPEFNTEVVLVSKLQHKNLVKLLGFCLASKEKILVYEFLPNSSLDRFLLDPAKKTLLDWKTRFKIIFGIARGLLYLHEDSRLKIIHRDLKPSNILLDKTMNAKISDFGLAKLFEVDQSQGNTNRIVGTQ